jgi:putative MATE family efflux protein
MFYPFDGMIDLTYDCNRCYIERLLVQLMVRRTQVPSESAGDRIQSRRHAMGRDPVWRLVSRFSGPAIISMTVASTYNVVDAIFVGRLGTTALAAMTATSPVVMALVAIASGTAIGATSLIARSMGAGDDEAADRTAAVAITLGFLINAIVAAICLPLLDRILGALGADQAVLPLARSYISVLITLYLFQYLSMVLASVIRADGSPMFASLVSICAGLLNVILDPLFIFGLGPVPSMGIRGAAIATVISQAAGTAVFAGRIILGKTGYTFRPSFFLPRWRIVSGIYRVGGAALVRAGAQFVAMGVVIRTAASFGVVPLAVLGILVRAVRFIQMPILGLGQGIMPVISYNFGADKKARVGEVVRKVALSGSVWSAVCWVVIMLFPTQVMAIFSGEKAFLAEGGEAIRLFAMISLTLGLQMVPGFFFQGIGKGGPAIVLVATQNLVFLLLPVLVLPRLFGLTGLWLSFAAADALSLALGLGWMRRGLRRNGIDFFDRNRAAGGTDVEVAPVPEER